MQEPIVDIVILSKATSQDKADMTQRAIDSALDNTDLPINIIVMEQTDHTYINATTIKIDIEFNYNKYANIGSESGNAEWVMIANNDLIFQDSWLEELLKANHPVVSPAEPNDVRQANLNGNETGFDGMRTFSGWCFMMKRKVWKDIGGFDETFNFWHSDSIVIHQLKQANIPPMIVKNSIVKHLGSQTLSSETQEKQNDYTWGDNQKFIDKFGIDPFDGIREL